LHVPQGQAVKERITRGDIETYLKQLLTEVTTLRGEQISDRSAIDSDLRMESVAFVELQVAVEERYDVQLDPIEVVERNEFRLIVDYVLELVIARNDELVRS
jgi:acyl carrier protein